METTKGCALGEVCAGRWDENPSRWRIFTEKPGGQSTGCPLCARGAPREGHAPSLGWGQDDSLEEVTMF